MTLARVAPPFERGQVTGRSLPVRTAFLGGRGRPYQMGKRDGHGRNLHHYVLRFLLSGQRLLTEKGVEFVEYDLDEQPAKHRKC